jgi:hypothetical protein
MGLVYGHSRKRPFFERWGTMSGRDGFRLSALLDTFTTKLLIAKNGMAITAKKLAQNPHSGQPKMPFYGS